MYNTTLELRAHNISIKLNGVMIAEPKNLSNKEIRSTFADGCMPFKHLKVLKHPSRYKQEDDDLSCRWKCTTGKKKTAFTCLFP